MNTIYQLETIYLLVISLFYFGFLMNNKFDYFRLSLLIISYINAFLCLIIFEYNIGNIFQIFSSKIVVDFFGNLRLILIFLSILIVAQIIYEIKMIYIANLEKFSR